MSPRFTIALSLAAGFFGAAAFRALEIVPVYAQTTAQAPQEIRAQKFVLVDEAGAPRGVFGIETNGAPVIEVLNSKGHLFEARFAGAKFFEGNVDPHAPKNPTLLTRR